MKKRFLKKHKFIIVIVVLLIIVSFFITYMFIPNDVKLIIANEEYTFVNGKTDSVVNLITLNSEFNIVIEKDNYFSNIKVNGEKVNKKKNLGIVEINNKNKIELEIKYKGESKYKKYIINTLPESMPVFNTIGESTTNGDFYFTTYAASYGKSNFGSGIFLVKMNNEGNIIFYREGGYNSYLFKKEIIDNKIYYSYLDEDENGKDNLCILDEEYNLIKKFKNDGFIDPHDYLLLDLNTYLVNIINDDEIEVITKISDDKVLWEHEFPISDFDDIGRDGEKIISRVQHHFNSFELDSDNNLLLSFRHSNEIVKLDINTGDIIWRLGGNKNNDFNTHIFYRQHSIVRKDDTYMVFSNNNKSIKSDFVYLDDGKSSVVVFNLDQENMKVENIKNYNLDCLSYQLGSVWPSDMINNIYVVDYGRSINKGKKGFQEINLETNEVYFTFEYPDVESSVYRVYKY